MQRTGPPRGWEHPGGVKLNTQDGMLIASWRHRLWETASFQFLSRLMRDRHPMALFRFFLVKHTQTHTRTHAHTYETNTTDVTKLN